MALKKTAAFTVMTFAMVMAAMPITASGNKDKEEDTSIPEKSVLHISGSAPAAFGEGGGIGAGHRPEGFEQIPDGIVSGEKAKTVTAELTPMTGILKVKGGKGNRKFTFQGDNGKSYSLHVEDSMAEHLANFKDKKVKAEGVFYGKDFLVFDFEILDF